MPDVLETLQKLPARCIADIGGETVIIQRGVMGYTPTHLTPEVYEHVPVSLAQRQAMIVGCTLGWDKQGADPDTYEQTNQLVPVEKKKFEFIVPFVMGCEFVYEAQALAEAEAEKLAYEIQEELQQIVEKDKRISSFSIDDQLQLTGVERIND